MVEVARKVSTTDEWLAVEIVSAVSAAVALVEDAVAGEASDGWTF